MRMCSKIVEVHPEARAAQWGSGHEMSTAHSRPCTPGLLIWSDCPQKGSRQVKYKSPGSHHCTSW